MGALPGPGFCTAEGIDFLEHLGKPVHRATNGLNEFTIIRNIMYWDMTGQLQKIRLPALVMGGKYDEVSPKVVKAFTGESQDYSLSDFQTALTCQCARRGEST